jgi:hypothetical protein
MEPEEGRYNVKGMDSPVFFEDLYNLLIDLFVCTHTEEIIGGATQDHRSITKDATINRGISAIRKKSQVIEDDGFNMFLPFETGVNSTLNEAVHGNGQFFNGMITKEGRDFRPPLRFSFTNVIKPCAINLEPGTIAIDIARVGSALKGIMNIEVIKIEVETRSDGNHNLERGGKNSMGIRAIVVMALDLETTMDADTDFMGSRLFELVKNQLKGYNSR